MEETQGLLSNAEICRYGRQLILTGMEWQMAIKGGRVLIVGAGGLGSPCLSYLCGAGVGKLGIVDHDIVDESNLQRQVLFFAVSLLVCGVFLRSTTKKKSRWCIMRLLLANPRVRVPRHL